MNGRLRVLMLTTQLGYGGSESNFVELAKYLSNTCDVTVAIFTRDYGRGDYALAVPDVPLHGSRRRRRASDLCFLQLAFSGIRQQVEREACAHNASTGER